MFACSAELKFRRVCVGASRLSRSKRYRADDRYNAIFERGLEVPTMDHQFQPLTLPSFYPPLPVWASNVTRLWSGRVDEVKERLGAELQEAGFQVNIKDLLG